MSRARVDDGRREVKGTDPVVLLLLVLGGLFLRAHVDVEGAADHSGSPNLLPFRCHIGMIRGYFAGFCGDG